MSENKQTPTLDEIKRRLAAATTRAEMFENAPTDIAFLIAEVERLTVELDIADIKIKGAIYFLLCPEFFPKKEPPHERK